MKHELITNDLGRDQLIECWQIDSEKLKLIYKVINGSIDLDQFKSVNQWRKQCYNPPNELEEKLKALNELIDGFGIESSRMEGYYKNHYWSDCICLYVNQGESYAITIIYDVVNDRFEFTSWGDWIEAMEQYLIDENN
jgi:hypothetical protein